MKKVLIVIMILGLAGWAFAMAAPAPTTPVYSIEAAYGPTDPPKEDVQAKTEASSAVKVASADTKATAKSATSCCKMMETCCKMLGCSPSKCSKAGSGSANCATKAQE